MLIVALGTACTAAAADSRAAPVPTPSYVPGPHFTSGRVIAIEGSQLRLATWDEGGQPIEVRMELALVRSVWRETNVGVSAIKLGDDVMADGVRRKDVFEAWNVSANIGRLDAIVRSIDGDALVVAPLVRGVESQQLIRVGISKFLRDDSLSLADVRPGQTISAVVYYERDAQGHIVLRRITKMWS